jgi:hypothetical protein
MNRLKQTLFLQMYEREKQLERVKETHSKHSLVVVVTNSWFCALQTVIIDSGLWTDYTLWKSVRDCGETYRADELKAIS